MVVGSQLDAQVEVVAAVDVGGCVARPGRWVVFDPEPLKAKLACLASGHADGAASDDGRPAAARRSA